MKSSICLICPKSCLLRPLSDPDVEGNKLCPGGEEFGRREAQNPHRHYFSTIRDQAGNLVPYRTREPIPLSKIEAFLTRLSEAGSGKDRQQLHEWFCQTYPTDLGKVEDQ